MVRETLLKLSFMYEESQAIGSPRGKRPSGAASRSSPKPSTPATVSTASSSAKGRGAGRGRRGWGAEEMSSASRCALRFGARGAHLTCMCKGSNEWVPACLRKWQESVVLSQPTYPSTRPT